MRPSQVMSLVEAVANVVVGLLSRCDPVVVFPILGLQAPLGQNVKLALAFTGVSIVRSFVAMRHGRTWSTRAID